MVDDMSVPECEKYKKFKLLTKEYWDCQFRYNTRPENHQAGTCKMGPSADPMAVVSPGLKVHGVDGLRVADASIMPQVSAFFPSIYNFNQNINNYFCFAFFF